MEDEDGHGKAIHNSQKGGYGKGKSIPGNYTGGLYRTIQEHKQVGFKRKMEDIVLKDKTHKIMRMGNDKKDKEEEGKMEEQKVEEEDLEMLIDGQKGSNVEQEGMSPVESEASGSNIEKDLSNKGESI